MSRTLLTFAGIPEAGPGGSTALSFLSGNGLDNSSTPIAYPLSIGLKLSKLTANLLGGVTPPGGGSLIIQLLRNGADVRGASITYSPGQTGVLTRKIKARYRRGDTLDVRVTAVGFSNNLNLVGQMTAMVAGAPTR